MPGLRLLIHLSAALGAWVLLRLTLGGWGMEAVGSVLRDTARASGVLGGLAFLAPVGPRLRDRPVTRWWARHEPALYLAFAWSQALHLGAIGLAFRLGSLSEKEASASFVRIGIVVYAVTVGLAMLALPGPRASLERKGWRLAHAAGMYFLWLAFVVSWARHFHDGWPYVALTASCLVALVLRALAAVRRRPSP